MAYYCMDEECGGECKPTLFQSLFSTFVFSDCCGAWVMDEEGNIIGPEDLAKAEAWLDRGALAQEN